MFWDGSRWVDETTKPTATLAPKKRRVRDWAATSLIGFALVALVIPSVGTSASTSTASVAAWSTSYNVTTLPGKQRRPDRLQRALGAASPRRLQRRQRALDGPATRRLHHHVQRLGHRLDRPGRTDARQRQGLSRWRLREDRVDARQHVPRAGRDLQGRVRGVRPPHPADRQPGIGGSSDRRGRQDRRPRQGPVDTRGAASRTRVTPTPAPTDAAPRHRLRPRLPHRRRPADADHHGRQGRLDHGRQRHDQLDASPSPRPARSSTGPRWRIRSCRRRSCRSTTPNTRSN